MASQTKVLTQNVGPFATGTRNGDTEGTMPLPSNAWLVQVTIHPHTPSTAPGMGFVTSEEARPMFCVINMGKSAAESPTVKSGWVRGGGHDGTANENPHWAHGLAWSGRVWTGDGYIVLCTAQNNTGINARFQIQVILEFP